MKATTRAAVIGGLAGTLCVAVSLAPMLRSQDHTPAPSSVAGRRAAALHDALDPTTTTLAAQPNSTTTVEETVVPQQFSERLGKVEQRVTNLEATTTTAAAPTTTTTYWQDNPDEPKPVVRMADPTATTSSTLPPACVGFQETC